MSKTTQTGKNVKQGLPWYRYPYVWILLIAVPFLTLLAAIATVYIAVASNESPAHESYYKRGLSPNELAPKENIAKTMGLTATLKVEKEQLMVVFNQKIENNELTIKFQHPTLERFDFFQTLHSVDKEQKTFVTKRPEALRQNKWDIFVDAPQQGWRIKGRLLDSEQQIELSPFGQ